MLLPGLASEHTLVLSGWKRRFYSARPKLNDRFETEIAGLYVGGDGAGITRGLAQASACGVWIDPRYRREIDALGEEPRAGPFKRGPGFFAVCLGTD